MKRGPDSTAETADCLCHNPPAGSLRVWVEMDMVLLSAVSDTLVQWSGRRADLVGDEVRPIPRVATAVTHNAKILLP